LRVTQHTVAASMLAGLQDNRSRMSVLEQQLSSGRRISKPSDDPVGTGEAMRYRVDIARHTQYQRNAQDGLSWLGTADNALQDGVTILQRLRTLTTQAANTGSGSTTSRAAIGAEVASLKQQMLSVANTNYAGRPIFGGTTSNTAAYVADAAGAVSYQGDSGAVMRSVGPDTQVRVDIDATVAFGPAGDDVFAMFDQIGSDLQADPANLTNDLSLISTALARVSSAQATEGAAYNRITAMNNSSTSMVANLTGSLSSVEDVDTAQAVTELTMQQVAYQASLAAMSNVLQLSLTEFLK
jgi:flagellar hook-associated protein 3 FlgL